MEKAMEKFTEKFTENDAVTTNPIHVVDLENQVTTIENRPYHIIKNTCSCIFGSIMIIGILFLVVAGPGYFLYTANIIDD